MGISKKIYEKKISQDNFEKKLPGIQKIFKKYVYMDMCVGGPTSDQGGSDKIYSYISFKPHEMKNQGR